MKITTKTRYGLRLILNLALSYGRGPALLSKIAKRENISQKYLGQIIIPLKVAGVITSVRGAKGGYMLNNLPAKITVKDIVEILQGNLDFVKESNGFTSGSKTFFCIRRLVWKKLQENISETLGDITLEDLVREYSQNEKNGVMYNI